MAVALTRAVAILIFLGQAHASAETSVAPHADLLAVATAAFRAQQYSEAAALYRAAARAPGQPRRALVMAGVAAYRSGDSTEARQLLDAALRLRLDQDDRELAITYRDLIEEDAAAARVWAFSAQALVSGGFDSNVTFAAANERERVSSGASRPGGVFAALSLGLSLERRLGAKGALSIEYSFDQIAYTVDPEHAGNGSQDHGLDFIPETWLGDLLRLRLPVRTSFALTGIPAASTPFQGMLTVDPEIAWKQGVGSKLRLSVGYTHKHSFDPEYQHLAGGRREATLTQDLYAAGWIASVFVRLRDERIGESRVTQEGSAPGRGCTRCEVETVNPYAYRGWTVGGRLFSPFSAPLRASVHGRIERRRHSGPAYIAVTDPALPGMSAAIDPRVRQDLRVAAGASVTLRLAAALHLIGRYEHQINRSTANGRGAKSCAAPGIVCHPFDADDRSYQRQTVSAALELEW